MANIKGINIEIGGNTTKLTDAIKDAQKVISATNRDLNEMKKIANFDSGLGGLKNWRVEQDALKKNINATKEKLDTLKEAQSQMGKYSKLTDEQKDKYRALSIEIAKSENSLKNMKHQLEILPNVNLDTLKDGFSKIGSGLSKVGSVATDVTKKMMQVSAAVGTALAGLVTGGIKSYADLEQNIGGVETLFGDSSNKVIENAKKAYATAGVSANEYMAGVTSFSASLLQSLGGDTEKAADVADMAFRDMSDNANKFGTDMSSIQNAYQGFAKQNYTMLD